jgi:hypothetical protein
VKNEELKKIFTGTVEFTVNLGETIDAQDIFPIYPNDGYYLNLGGASFSLSGTGDFFNPTPANIESV